MIIRSLVMRASVALILLLSLGGSSASRAQIPPETKDGKAIAGIIVDDQPDRLLLKDAQGKVATIRKQDIEERTRSDVSVMPELLAGEFTRQELADLLQFLAELK